MTIEEKICYTLQCGMYRVLVQLLTTYFEGHKVGSNIARHTAVGLVNPAFFSSCMAPTLENNLDSGFLEFN